MHTSYILLFITKFSDDVKIWLHVVSTLGEDTGIELITKTQRNLIVFVVGLKPVD